MCFVYVFFDGDVDLTGGVFGVLCWLLVVFDDLVVSAVC